MVEKIPVRIEIDGIDYFVGELAYEPEKATRSLAFRYDDSWTKIGFSLGSDLPLKTEAQLLRTFGNDPKSPPLFSFLKDHACGQWIGLLENTLYKEVAAAECSAVEKLLKFPHPRTRFSSLGFGDIKDDVFEPIRLDRQYTNQLIRATESFFRSPSQVTHVEAKMLLSASSDFGGEKIKFLVLGEKGEEKILRPRNPHSRIDESLWIALTQSLAKSMGIRVLSGELIPGVGYLESRFDRKNGKKQFCLSAATLIEKRLVGKPASWLDVADILNRAGSKPKEDLEELFKRLLFDVLTANSRSNLNRLWFYRENGGWRLAPLSSPLPTPPVFRQREIALPIVKNDSRAEPQSALSVASYFGLTERKAQETLLSFQQELTTWEKLAKNYGAPMSEIALMRSAFFN